MFKKLIFVLCILLLSTNVYAIGISPAKVNFEFESGMVRHIPFKVFNVGDHTLNAKIFLRGDLKEYFDFEPVNVTLEPKEEIEFNITLSLPTNVDLDPGDRRTDIVAEEFLESGSGVGAVAAVGLLVIVRVPYEGQYVDLDLMAKNAEIGEDVEFFVKLESLGLETVNKVDGTLNIFDETGIKVGTLSFVEPEIAPKEIRELELVWNSGNNLAGIYKAKLVINYAGKERDVEAQFRLGDLSIQVVDLIEKELISEGINKLLVVTQSQWNNQIDDVYTEVEIGGKKSKSEMTYYKPWSQNNITVYFDTHDLSLGNYKAKVTIFYENLTTEEMFDVQIINENPFNIYIIYGLIAGAIIVVLFFFIKKRKLFKSRDKLK